MQVLDKPSPKWYSSISSTINEIEANCAAYEDKEDGVFAPGRKVFERIRAFIGALKMDESGELESPRISVSDNGNLDLIFGSKKRSLDITFTGNSTLYFFRKDEEKRSGDGDSQAIKLISEFFRIQG
jgi:hypothetical protein